MIERWRLWSTDDVEVWVYVSWRSWLIGVQVDSWRHEAQAQAQAHLGPVMLHVWWRRNRTKRRLHLVQRG